MAALLTVLCLLLCALISHSFKPIMPVSTRLVSKNSKTSMSMALDAPTTMLLNAASKVIEEVASKDGYVYGAVNAPDFVLPLGALLIVLTAAIPFLLRPGEDALEQQRLNEEKKGNAFGSGDAVGKRKKDL